MRVQSASCEPWAWACADPSPVLYFHRVAACRPRRFTTMLNPRQILTFAPWRMSALGHKQTYALQDVMSALPSKPDMCSATAHVCLGPKADMRTATRSPRRRAQDNRCHTLWIDVEGQERERRIAWISPLMY